MVVLFTANAITNAIAAAKLAWSEIQEWVNPEMLAAVQETRRNHCLHDAPTIASLEPAPNKV